MEVLFGLRKAADVGGVEGAGKEIGRDDGMRSLVDLDEVIFILEQQQKKLCPLGRFSRNATYGADREAFDSWQKMIDQVNELPVIEMEE